jgi:hypothetical protein
MIPSEDPLLIGVDHAAALVEGRTYSAKLVFNQSGAIFGPVWTQHRDMKATSISYEDDYKGNALAAMLAPGKIEIRFHKAFKDQKVATILRQLLAAPELAAMRSWQVTNQGRPIDCSPDRHE